MTRKAKGDILMKAGGEAGQEKWPWKTKASVIHGCDSF